VRYQGLKNGDVVLLRAPTMDDKERSQRFFEGLSPEDRRYLRVDVTRPEYVERRIREAESGEIHRVVAVVDDDIVADGALEVTGDGWHRHQGEIRAIVAQSHRRLRLGALLVQELFRIAEKQEVEKVVAKMAAPQQAAVRIFDRLGFVEDAVLPDFVKDQHGQLQDLIVMSCKLDAVIRELRDFYREDNWPDG